MKRVCTLILILAVLIPLSAFGTDSTKEKENLVKFGKWTGDYQQMVERLAIRVLVPYSKTFYFLDKGSQKGMTYEMLKKFETVINKELKKKHLKVHLIFIPTDREKLIPDLVKGLGDIAAGNLTITDQRLKQVDFSDPFLTGVNEILVTGPKSSHVKSFSDLSGLKVHVRKSSSYYESLIKTNQQFAAEGKPEIEIIPANDLLEDEDLLEMLNAGLIPAIVIDSHKGEFWSQIFENITLHPEIKFRESGKIAWAIRKNSPEFKAVINKFVKANKKGTLMGNILFNRYLKSTKYIKNNLDDEDRQRFIDTLEFFKKYAEQYDFDWLLLAALAYQESTIDQSKRSHAGAIGVMQVLPSTAKDKNVNIPNIDEVAPNIHAGTKYLRFIMDRYFDNPEINQIDRVLLTFASYNAGPAKISRLRKEAKSMNLNPNIWFKNVEVVAAKRIGRETVQYVGNIFKYYIAYTFIAAPENSLIR